jgi:hypothetical protein
MKKFFEVYYVHVLKPSVSVITILANLYYLNQSNYINEFFYVLYMVTFMIKPLFYLTLLFGLFLNSKERTFKSLAMTFITVICIFFGLPVKEYFDFINSDIFGEYFGNSGYLVSEYNLSHFIANLLIENIPLLALTYLNNYMLGKYQDVIIDPIIMNITYFITNTMLICILSYNKINL